MTFYLCVKFIKFASGIPAAINRVDLKKEGIAYGGRVSTKRPSEVSRVAVVPNCGALAGTV